MTYHVQADNLTLHFPVPVTAIFMMNMTHHSCLRGAFAALAICLICTVARGDSLAASTVEEAPVRIGLTGDHQCVDPETNSTLSYTLIEPTTVLPQHKRSLLIYLYGAGGSMRHYNLSQSAYDSLRSRLSEQGYYVLVPELGKLHFMSPAAKSSLNVIVDDALKQVGVSHDRVHIMGTSMGGGSALAYAIHRRDLIRSVTAIMPMTDMAAWVVENPNYAPALAESYGGTAEQVPDIYRENSAMQNLDAFASIPVTLVHGTADKIVSSENSVRFADAMKGKGYKCVLHMVEGVGHVNEVVLNHGIAIVDVMDGATAMCRSPNTSD